MGQGDDRRVYADEALDVRGRSLNWKDGKDGKGGKE
jgi:hypothetical protein